MDLKRVLHYAIIFVFVSLYALVSIISIKHIIEFFELSNNYNMSLTLAVAFEIGAMASLLGLAILNRIEEWVVWMLFIILTLFQAMGNVYSSYVALTPESISSWIELFGLTDFSAIQQKRIVAITSGLPLPIIALGFIKSLIDYLRPNNQEKSEEPVKEEKKSEKPIKEEKKPGKESEDKLEEEKKKQEKTNQSELKSSNKEWDQIFNPTDNQDDSQQVDEKFDRNIQDMMKKEEPNKGSINDYVEREKERNKPQATSKKDFNSFVVSRHQNNTML